jgi:hypothetical protein
MFPPNFARENIEAHTEPGDLVLDCFSGRGTTLLEALLSCRRVLASDINPVAFCVSAAKASRPELGFVLDRIDELEERYSRVDPVRLEVDRKTLPPFFRAAFASETLRQLLFLRRRLNWRQDPEHAFIAALALGHLHGETNRSSSYCSNQMPHTLSTKPTYSRKYWRDRSLRPPDRDVFELLRERADYRLAEGAPIGNARVALCDARNVDDHFQSFRGRVSAVITSPPYLDTTRFEEDQWLRLWFLGGPPRPTYHKVSKDDRYERAQPYWAFLEAAWRGMAPLLKPSAVLVCRLGAKGLDPKAIREGFTKSIRAVWPRANLLGEPVRSALQGRQSRALNPDAVGCRYELDFTFRLAR